MNILDIHSHKTPSAENAITAICLPEDFPEYVPGHFYSAGIHPKDAMKADEETFRLLRQIAGTPETIAIGECGADTLINTPMAFQINVLRKQIELSEELGKPLIIHDVRAHETIIGIRKESHARQPWIIHGFRGKPSVAQMLLKAGCMLSFGEKFNPETVRITPAELIFAETDESTIPISGIIDRISETAGMDMRPIIESNIRRTFNPTG